MSLDDGSDARGARGTLTDRNLRQVHELDDDSCISSEVLEAISHVDEMVSNLRAKYLSCDRTITRLVCAASACREAADRMNELRSELRSQQAKRRRVALEDHDAASACTSARRQRATSRSVVVAGQATRANLNR